MSIKELEKKIYELAKVQGLTNERVEPIIDGLYDPALFNGICWLMKEPFDEVIDGKPWGGGWSLIDRFEKPYAW